MDAAAVALVYSYRPPSVKWNEFNSINTENDGPGRKKCLQFQGIMFHQPYTTYRRVVPAAYFIISQGYSVYKMVGPMESEGIMLWKQALL